MTKLSNRFIKNYIQTSQDGDALDMIRKKEFHTQFSDIHNFAVGQQMNAPDYSPIRSHLFDDESKFMDHAKKFVAGPHDYPRSVTTRLSVNTAHESGPYIVDHHTGQVLGEFDRQKSKGYIHRFF